MKYRVISPHKIIFCGSYLVLDGAPALALAVEPLLILEGRPVKENLHKIDEINSEMEKIAEKNQFISAVLRVLREKFFVKPYLKWEDFYSDEVAGWGLGSSAAFTSALLALLSHSSGLALSKAELLRSARRAHFLAQGKKGSGLDIAASVLGGVVAARDCNTDSPDYRILNWPQSVKIILIKSPQKADSRKLISSYFNLPLEERFNLELIDKIEKVMTALLEGDPDAFIQSLADCAQLEKEWSAKLQLPYWSETEIDHISSNIRKFLRDAPFVVKPHGAGGGDSICCFFKGSEQSAEQLSRYLRELGFRARTISPSPDGLTLTSLPD